MSTKKLTNKIIKDVGKAALGQRIGLVIEKTGFQQKEIAEHLGVHPAELSRWVKGKSAPVFSRLVEISKLVNCNLQWLATGEERMEKTPAQIHKEKKDKLENEALENIGKKLKGIREAIRNMQREEMPAAAAEVVKGFDEVDHLFQGLATNLVIYRPEPEKEVPEGFVLVPRYDVQATAGSGSVIHSEQIVDSLAFRSSWIRDLGLKPDALALISARGDSMTPTLNPGDLLLVDLSTASVHEDAIYAIQNDGTLIVKRVQKMMDGSIVIKSDNPAYRDQVIEKGLLETVRIVGRIVWAGRRL